MPASNLSTKANHDPGTASGSDLGTDLDGERAHLTAARAALRRMREQAEDLYLAGERVAGDPYSAETLGRQLSQRILELADRPDTPLFFGRLDFGSTTAATPAAAVAGQDDDHAGRAYHIGRRHVTDAAGEPLVLDWRAPLSRRFYQASASDPQGIAVRRRFGFAGGELTSFEDERLDRGEELGTASRILTAEIERPRVGPMRDIVATIQPEQDVLVRAELTESICVQGAPGTGKTAVGLHRAAYLLYLYRQRLRRSGLLIVGPNRAFLRYIAAVLPALGEIDVKQSTVDDLLPVPTRGVDEPAAAAVKHDARMAAVLARALWGQVHRPTEPLMISDGSFRWRISVEALCRLVDDVRREAPPYAVGRQRVRARVVGLLMRQAEARRAESPSESWQRKMGRSRPVTELLDRVWPAVTAAGLVHSLLADPATLAAAADGVLTPDEQRLVGWAKPPKSPRSARWSAADAVLIDEAAGLIDQTSGFGHIVVDEAQDLSPMQLRAIGRRSVHGSVTLLGDLAQGTSPWAATDWGTALRHLGKPDAGVVALSTGFRVPSAVIALANRLLPALGVDVPAARSLRRDGRLRVTQVRDLRAATVSAVRDALEHEGSIAVIAADADLPPLADALAAAGITTVTPDEDGEGVTVLPATLAKGLEYDHVIVVEPAGIVAAEPRGLGRLFVVLTRAVSRLDVLHADPLPTAMRE